MSSNKLTMTLFLFFLEMVLVSVVADNTTTVTYSTTKDIKRTTENSPVNITSLPAFTGNITDNSSTSTLPPQNNKNGSKTDSFTSVFSSNKSKAATVVPTSALVRTSTKPPPTTATPRIPPTSRKPTIIVKTTDKKTHASESADHIVIIVLGIIVLVVLASGAICFFTRRRVRRYSVDLTHRADDANIPLSTLEPELPAESVPLNGLQTFEGTETSAKEPEEPEVKPATQEEQKSLPVLKDEVGEPATDPSSASAAAAPTPAPDSSEDKPKEDAVEGSFLADVKPSSEEKTDDEGAVSNKTSVESLKETNENNSNNADSGQKTDVQTGNTLQDVCVDCPV